MKTEKQNNLIQEAVTDLHQLPEGFSFNANKVWQQLENELQPKQKNKSLVFYMAAAVVLLVLISTFSLFQPHQTIKLGLIHKQHFVQEQKENNAGVIVNLQKEVNKIDRTIKSQTGNGYATSHKLLIKEVDSVSTTNENSRTTTIQPEELLTISGTTAAINDIPKNNAAPKRICRSLKLLI